MDILQNNLGYNKIDIISRFRLHLYCWTRAINRTHTRTLTWKSGVYYVRLINDRMAWLQTHYYFYICLILFSSPPHDRDIVMWIGDVISGEGLLFTTFKKKLLIHLGPVLLIALNKYTTFRRHSSGYRCCRIFRLIIFLVNSVVREWRLLLKFVVRINVSTAGRWGCGCCGCACVNRCGCASKIAYNSVLRSASNRGSDGNNITTNDLRYAMFSTQWWLVCRESCPVVGIERHSNRWKWLMTRIWKEKKK